MDADRTSSQGFDLSFDCTNMYSHISLITSVTEKLN